MAFIIGIEPARAAQTDAEFKVGALGMTHDGKLYKYVQYKEGTAAVDGVADEVCYYYLAGGYVDGTVTSDLTDSVNVGAGVLQVAMSDNEYGWIQIKGPATVALALTAGADGNALTPVGSADGTLDVSALVTDHVCAIADDISAKEIVCDFPF